MNLSTYCLNLPTLLVFWGDFSSSFSCSNVLIVLIPWGSGIPSLWKHHHYIYKLGHSITYCQNCEAVNTTKQYFWTRWPCCWVYWLNMILSQLPFFWFSFITYFNFNVFLHCMLNISRQMKQFLVELINFLLNFNDYIYNTIHQSV